MTGNPIPQEPLPSMAELNRILAPYQKADTRHSFIQLANTLIPYFILWYLMIRSLEVSYADPVLLGSALFLVRIFYHLPRRGHNSFFPSNELKRRWDLAGPLCYTGEQCAFTRHSSCHQRQS